jgi:FdhD protein
MTSSFQYEVLKNGKEQSDFVAVEIPVQLILNNQKTTISMCSPNQLEHWAIGLLFTEGFIQSISDVNQIRSIENQGQIEIHVQTNVLEKRTSAMSLLSVTACGICGKSSFEAISGVSLSSDIKQVNVSRLIQKLNEVQPVFEQTGATHAAGLFNEFDELLSAAEDVGRHNAVDKCIGDLLQKERLSSAKYLVVTSRVSYEIVAKAFKANVPIIVAVSAPTSLAIDFCKELGIQLYGFVRGENFTRYA